MNKFQVPTIKEIASYCKERGNAVDPEQFFDFYESKGWMVGRNKMKNWQAAVRNWERRRKAEKLSTGYQQPVHRVPGVEESDAYLKSLGMGE